MPAWTARCNKAVNNRLFSLIAPYVPPYALVIHRGRRSGVEYRTPALGFRSGDTILISLPYGERSDWVLPRPLRLAARTPPKVLLARINSSPDQQPPTIRKQSEVSPCPHAH